MQVVAFGLLILGLLAGLVWLRQRQTEAYGLPLVAIFVFAFLYVVQPLVLLNEGVLDQFVTPEQLIKGLLVPLLMLLCFLAGWAKGERRGIREPSLQGWDPGTVYRWGLVTAALGLTLVVMFTRLSGGVREFYSRPHGMAGAWTDTTAYLYSSPFWILSGTALMLLACSRARRDAWGRVPILLFGGLMLGHVVLMSSRGLLFATASTMLVSLCLAGRVRADVTKALYTLVAVGLGVILLVGYRDVLHLGEPTGEAPPLPQALAATLTIDQTHLRLRITGSEFVYHALAIDTVDGTGKYHLGLNWIYSATVHAIPRVLWPDKPYGFETGGITWADIEAHTGVRIAGGSAPGIVADIYCQFGMWSVMFFFAFGWLARRLMDWAQMLTSPLASVAYVMLHALSLNTFAQGFGALIVPFLYSLIPVVAYAALTRSRPEPASERTKVTHKVRMSRPGWPGLAGG